MGQVTVTLPDGSQKIFEKGLSYQDVAEKIGRRLAKASLAAKVDQSSLVDMQRRIDSDCNLSFVTADSEEGLEVLRHSTAHVLAMAVQRLWKEAKVTIGPVIKDGFYYDFDFPSSVKLSEKDLPAIENEMRRIIKEGYKVYRKVLSRSEACEIFRRLGETYKVEIIEELPAEAEITIYEMGGWFDLCRGPHVPSLQALGAFKLTSVGGAYWRGDERNPMLTRIYGTAWAEQKDLDAYLFRIEEAKRRDHRLLGKQLDLFSFHPEAPGHVFFHEKGNFLYQKLLSYVRKSNQRFGFQEVNTPLMMNVDLWHQSGHFANYSENMYFIDRDDIKAAVKPMNCPGHCLIYGAQKRSYRELPLKLAEFGRVHRHEKSGVVSGLFRVRSFVQDDAHIFCQTDDIFAMVSLVMKQVREAYEGLGFSQYHMELSTRPAKSIGSDAMWEQAETALKVALEEANAPYKLNPGDGAFYGPKIDFHLIDALGRSWQCGTIQLDFSMPERFHLEFVGKENRVERPVMIHRAVLGSLERFLGIFIEHFGGHFPLWAAPIQAQLLTVTNGQDTYAHEVANTLQTLGVRCALDLRHEKLGFKIREAQMQKVPYMIVLGDKECEQRVISPRRRDGKQLEPMKPESFASLVAQECGELWQL